MVQKGKPRDQHSLPYVRGMKKQYQTGDSPARNWAISKVNFSNGERRIGGEDMVLYREAVKTANHRHWEEKYKGSEDRDNIVCNYSNMLMLFLSLLTQTQVMSYATNCCSPPSRNLGCETIRFISASDQVCSFLDKGAITDTVNDFAINTSHYVILLPYLL